jgi:hypothetical protein
MATMILQLDLFLRWCVKKKKIEFGNYIYTRRINNIWKKTNNEWTISRVWKKPFKNEPFNDTHRIAWYIPSMHIDTLPYNKEFVIIEHQLIEDHKKTQTIAKKSTLQSWYVSWTFDEELTRSHHGCSWDFIGLSCMWSPLKTPSNSIAIKASHQVYNQ